MSGFGRSRLDEEMEMADQSQIQNSAAEQSQSPVLTTFRTGRKRKLVDQSDLCQQLYESICNLKKENGSMLCDSLPMSQIESQEGPSSQHLDPTQNPIYMNEVQQKLKHHLYAHIDELTSDIEMVVKNIKTFYPPESVEYHDATQLWQYVTAIKAKLLNDGSNETKRAVQQSNYELSLNDDDDNSFLIDNYQNASSPFEELFATIMTAYNSLTNSPLSSQFQELPSKRDFPDYYDVVSYPINLKTIANKIQSQTYATLFEMEIDFNRLIENTLAFFKPQTDIYQNAVELRRIFVARKMEIEQGTGTSIAGASDFVNGMAAAMSLKMEEDGDFDNGATDGMCREGDGPMWLLLEQLYNALSSSGSFLGESLWRLPSRQQFPDYYNVVTRPISLSQVRCYLRAGTYSTIDEMIADIDSVVKNVKRAYSNSHQIFRDADQMYRILHGNEIDPLGGIEEHSIVENEESISSVTSIPNLSPSTPMVQSQIVVTIPTPPTPTTPAGKKKKPTMFANSTTAHPTSDVTPKIKSRATGGTPNLKKKLLALHKYLMEFTIGDRLPMKYFMEKPTKNLHPDYYEVVQHPIDMTTIETNIRAGRYVTIDDIVGEYRLMFSNCRKYYAETSKMHVDANLLENALNEKLKEISGLAPKTVRARNKRLLTPLDETLRRFYNAIRDYKETMSNRQLALIFMKLPAKNVHPDYYDKIKTPIGMEKIAHKMNHSMYASLDELYKDFILMFENACTYNEPGSHIYRYALTLQSVVLKTRQQFLLEVNPEAIPDVGQAIQDLFMVLFSIFYNHQDEEGRWFSDSLMEVPDYDEVDGVKMRAISLDLIKRRLEKNLYKRLDIFQEDVFACLDRARKLARTDSQVFEDSMELQSFFIRKRDELCKNGDILSSSALSYSILHLRAAVEAVRQSKLLQEQHDDEQEREEEMRQEVELAQHNPIGQTQSVTNEDISYSIGDFVYYVRGGSENDVAGIMHVKGIYINDDNTETAIFGNVFIRPSETPFVKTRRFLDQEVLRTEQLQFIPVRNVLGKCHVMHFSQYFTLHPEDIPDYDVYVCEQKYNTRTKSIKKLLIWPKLENSSVKIVNRDVKLEVRRAKLMVRDRAEDKEIFYDGLIEDMIIEKERPNVAIFMNGNEDEDMYYEQYNTMSSGVVKTGDFVYVATENEKQSIVQIHAIWTSSDNKTYFRGPWLLPPNETNADPQCLCYKQEVLLSTLQEAQPIYAVMGRCAVLNMDEYVASRPTEILEPDVYVCESMYDEMTKHIRRFQGSGLRRFNHSQMVVTDEIYHFPKPITPMRMSVAELMTPQDYLNRETTDTPVYQQSQLEQIKTEPVIVQEVYQTPPPPPQLLPPQPQTQSLQITTNGIESGGLRVQQPDADVLLEDSLDGAASQSIASDLASTSSPAPSTPVSTPIVTTTKKAKQKGVVTGFILYSSVVRKSVVQNNPDCSFGDISRIVGNEWRSLGAADKQHWEEKARKVTADAIEGRECASPAPQAPVAAGSESTVINQVFECNWVDCDHQFEDLSDCMDHLFAENTGHVVRHFANREPTGETEFQCQWRDCLRVKKQTPPFPVLWRLVKHIRDVHANKDKGKVILPRDRSKNFVASKKPPPPPSQIPQQNTSPLLQASHSSTTTTTTTNTVNSSGVAQEIPTPNPMESLAKDSPAEPLFITVPPRPQRVLHSEAYINYIEGLQDDARFITPWEKTIRATQETIPPPDATKLPTHWLGSRVPESSEDVINALWQLRNFMMKDVLQIHKNIF